MSNCSRSMAIALCAAAAGTLAAQEEHATRGGRRALMEPPREIALARSAAPRDVSGDATIYVLTDTGYAVAVRGSNGNACYVNRSWPASLEPHCFDAEGAATVMRVELQRMRGVQRGTPAEEIDRGLRDAIAGGAIRLPRRPAMSYRMSAGQRLVDADGKPVGKWEPHLMLYIPYATAREFGLTGAPSTAAALVVAPGTPMASVMIVVRQFVPVEGDLDAHGSP